MTSGSSDLTGSNKFYYATIYAPERYVTHYEKGTYRTTIDANDSNTYHSGMRNADGYWYEYIGKF